MYNPASSHHKEVNVTVTLGEHNVYGSTTKVSLKISHDSSDFGQMFHNTQGLNPQTDIIVNAMFTTKSSADPLSSGETTGFFKNYINMAKDAARFKNVFIDMARDPNTYSDCYRVCLAWDSTTLPDSESLNAFSTGFTQVGHENVDVSLEINQKFQTSQYDTDEPRLSAKLMGNARFNQTVLDTFIHNYLNSGAYINSDTRAFCHMIHIFLSGSLDLKFNSIESLLDNNFIKLPEGIPRVSGFVALRQFLVPQMGQLYGEVGRDPQIAQIFDAVYAKVYENISGISEVKFGFKGIVVTFKFEHFNLFQGFMPSLEDIKVYSVEDPNPMDFD